MVEQSWCGLRVRLARPAIARPRKVMAGGGCIPVRRIRKRVQILVSVLYSRHTGCHCRIHPRQPMSPTADRHAERAERNALIQDLRRGGATLEQLSTRFGITEQRVSR